MARAVPPPYDTVLVVTVPPFVAEVYRDPEHCPHDTAPCGSCPPWYAWVLRDQTGEIVELDEGYTDAGAAFGDAAATAAERRSG